MCAGVLPVWSLCPVSLLRPPISTLFPYTTLFRSAWVGDLVKMLQELAPAELGQTAQKGQAAKFSVVADERSNRLLIKGDDNFRVRIRDLVYKLDQPAVSSGTTQVIRLRHADAKTMAELLRGLMGQMASATGTASTGGATAAAPRAAGRASTGN